MQGHPAGLDLTRLQEYLDQHIPGLLRGSLTAEQIEGGRSNLTYLVADDCHRWVLRRPPLGHVLPTAHDMTREYRVIGGLRGTDVPVPDPVILCQDIDVIGAPFYLMEFVEGVPYSSAAELDALGPERVENITSSLVDTLAALHRVDPEANGLGDFGRPEGFMARQLHRWTVQLGSSATRELRGIDQLRERLTRQLPRSGPPAIVHGDYRLDNVLIDADDRVVAVLDWEMATLGDPLADMGLLIAYSECGRAGIPAVADTGAATGYLPAEKLIGRYEQATGRDLQALNWYIGFAFFKLAVIAEGIHTRFIQGKTVGEGFENIGDCVVPLVQLGSQALED